MGLAGSHVLAGEEALRSLSSNSICGVWWGLIVAVFSIMVCPLTPFVFVACFESILMSDLVLSRMGQTVILGFRLAILYFDRFIHHHCRNRGSGSFHLGQERPRDPLARLAPEPEFEGYYWCFDQHRLCVWW